MDSVIGSPVELGMHWPTIDPFLFCAHHHDHYPSGDGQLGPAASLDGRDLGADFEGLDGWRMYHGTRIPGFPQHPHRGFETVTYVRRGVVDHSDSLGASARFSTGDTQWVTAGDGIVHSEMFPLLSVDSTNDAEFFQIWLNLPSADKHAPAHFSMLWSEDIPVVRRPSPEGDALVTVIAGAFDGVLPPAAPPRSWAASADNDVAIWHLEIPAGARCDLPPAERTDTRRVVYVYSDDGLAVDGYELPGRHAVEVTASGRVSLEVDHVNAGGPVTALILQGRPIGEPVAQWGPFVLNDAAGVRQAQLDYQRTGFGGWPWPSDDPVHPTDAGRFARHPDGRVEQPEARST